MKKYLYFLPLALVLLITPIQSKPVTLHVLMVIDTKDKNIGCIYDLKNWNNLLPDIKKYTKMKINQIVLKDNAWDDKNVIAAIKKIEPAKNDVIIFYYSGHGFRFKQNQKDPWPYLALQNSSMSLYKIYSYLHKKKPRLLLTISDSCNSYCPGSPPNVQSRAYAPKNIIEKNYRNLFLLGKGTIIASGCLPGQYSYGGKPDGGAYTSTLLKNIRLAVTTDKATWKQIFQASNAKLVGGKQQPQYKMNVDPINSAISSNINQNTSNQNTNAGGDISFNQLKDPEWCVQAITTYNIFNDAAVVFKDKQYLPSKTKEYKKLLDYVQMQYNFVKKDFPNDTFSLNSWMNSIKLIKGCSNKYKAKKLRTKFFKFIQEEQVSWLDTINNMACVKKKKGQKKK